MPPMPRRRKPPNAVPAMPTQSAVRVCLAGARAIRGDPESPWCRVRTVCAALQARRSDCPPRVRREQGPPGPGASRCMACWLLGVPLTRARSVLIPPSLGTPVQTIVFAILLGLIWLQEGGDESGPTVQAIAGVLFFVRPTPASARTWHPGAPKPSPAIR
jgi:hypothetical protein